MYMSFPVVVLVRSGAPSGISKGAFRSVMVVNGIDGYDRNIRTVGIHNRGVEQGPTSVVGAQLDDGVRFGVPDILSDLDGICGVHESVRIEID